MSRSSCSRVVGTLALLLVTVVRYDEGPANRSEAKGRREEATRTPASRRSHSGSTQAQCRLTSSLAARFRQNDNSKLAGSSVTARLPKLLRRSRSDPISLMIMYFFASYVAKGFYYWNALTVLIPSSTFSTVTLAGDFLS